jgi:hypothetical protein
LEGKIKGELTVLDIILLFNYGVAQLKLFIEEGSHEMS